MRAQDVNVFFLKVLGIKESLSLYKEIANKENTRQKYKTGLKEAFQNEGT